MKKSFQSFLLLLLLASNTFAQELNVSLEKINSAGFPFVWALTMDADSNLYAGDELGALHTKKKGESTWTKNTAFNIGNTEIRGVSVFSPTDIWVSTNGKGISRFNGSWNSFTVADGLPDDNNWRKIVKDNDGAYWVYNRNKGLAKYKNFEWSFYTNADLKLDFSSFSDMILASDGTIWVGSSYQIASYKDGIWQLHDLKKIFNKSQLSVNSFYEDKKGTIWVCTLKGLYAYENNIWVDKTAMSGPVEVQVMTIDKNETIWYQEYNVGLVRYKNGIKQTFAGSTTNKIPTQAWVMLVNSKNEKLLVGNKGANLIIVNDDALSTGTKENIVNELSIYPNPSQDYINISGDADNARYDIFDLYGHKVSVGTVIKNRIDITALPVGQYLLKLNKGQFEYKNTIIKI
jgi:ligand-binding sensor domain-containing protein